MIERAHARGQRRPWRDAAAADPQREAVVSAAAVPQVRGELFLARFSFVRDTYGTAGLAGLLGALKESDRRELETVVERQWYTFGLLNRLDRAIAERLAGNDAAVYERLGAASARDRTMALKDVAAFVSVHGFLARTAEEHRRFHTFGRASYRRISFTEGELTYLDYPEPDRVYCLGGLGYLRAAVEQLAGPPVAAEERWCQCRGDAACVFHLQWGRRGAGGTS